MSKTILIIDDDDDIREVAQLTLELGASWNVVSANSGVSGVDAAVAHHPDAILLDVMMPGMDGPATLDRLRADARTREIPVVFLTAKARTSERERLESCAVAGVLDKPFDPTMLPSQLASLLGWETTS
jgi:CheY-like chemotaxis protein